MGTFNGIIVDKINVDKGLPPRFVHQFEIDSRAFNAPGFKINGSWRQAKGNDRNYWKTAGSNWAHELQSTQVPGGRVNQSLVHLYDGSVTQKKLLGIFNQTELNKSVTLQLPMNVNSQTFPSTNIKSTGFLFESGDFTDQRIKDKTPNIYWMTTDQQLEIPPLENLWFGGGVSYGGKAVVYGKSALHGWLINLQTPSKKRYFQVETTSHLQFALGGKTGIAIILVNATDPFNLLNQPSSSGWNFSLCLGGGVSSLLKGVVKSEKFANFLKAAKLAEKIYDAKGGIMNAKRIGDISHLKTLFASTALATAPSFCVIDTPLEIGLEAGIAKEHSKVTLIQ